MRRTPFVQTWSLRGLPGPAPAPRVWGEGYPTLPYLRSSCHPRTSASSRTSLRSPTRARWRSGRAHAAALMTQSPAPVAETAIHRSESAPAAASSTAAPPPSPPSYGSPLSASTSTSTLAPASASPYCSCKCAGAAALATPAPRGCGGSAARRRGWTLAQTRPYISCCPR